jgi:hypothetical protein
LGIKYQQQLSWSVEEVYALLVVTGSAAYNNGNNQRKGGYFYMSSENAKPKKDLKMKRKIFVVFILSILLLFSLAVCYIANTDKEPTVAEDEVLLLFDLDTQDELYQVSMDCLVDGQVVSSAGIRNADSTPFVENDRIYDPFKLGTEYDISKLSLQLYVADFINDFGDHEGEYKVENELNLLAEYGTIYYITISGDKENGYSATVKTTDPKKDEK